jgi:hypothetical protein
MAGNIDAWLQGFASITSNAAVVIFSLIILGMIFGLIALIIIKQRRWKQFRCVIFEKDAFGQKVIDFDDAGIFVDGKTKNKRFFLKKYNVGLTPDNVPYVPAGKTKLVFLYRSGHKNFRYINFNVTDNGMAIKVGEEDLNWAINAYERQKKLFSSSMLLQYMPFIMLAFVSIIILIIFIYFFRHFSDLASFAEAMKEAMKYYAQANSGTTVITTP